MSGIIGTSHSKSKVIGKSLDTAKAWVNFNGDADVIRDSFGVSSMGFDDTGEYSINLSTTLSTNAVAVGGCDPVTSVADFYVSAMSLMMNTATQVKCITIDYGPDLIKSVTRLNHIHVMIAVFGD